MGPRDGLQSIGVSLATDAKVELVDAVGEAGVSRIEAGSFVSPRAVPQMADSAAVFRRAARRPDTRLEALVVTVDGAERAIAAGADILVAVVAASETFSRRNVRMGTEEALTTTGVLAARAREQGVPCVADVATAFGCAYEGSVPEKRVADVAERLVGLGITEVTFADTTGMADPRAVESLVETASRVFGGAVTIGLHFHNTRGLGLANVCAALDAGARLFDSSIGGIGGCPFSPGATGNIATEDLVHLLHLLGYETGIDLARLITAARRAEELLGFTLPGQVMRAGPSPVLTER